MQLLKPSYTKKGKLGVMWYSFNSANLLHDEEKVHIGGRHRSNVRDYCCDFALQAIQELL